MQKDILKWGENATIFDSKDNYPVPQAATGGFKFIRYNPDLKS
jgi:hypothetical protein